MDYMERYEYLKGLVVSDRKEEFNALMKYLEEETEYLRAPASSKYHMSCKSGLLIHSISVAATMVRIKRLLFPNISDEVCVILGLLHDVGKVGYPGQPNYIENEPTDKQKQYGFKPTVPYSYNNDITFMTHAHRSIYHISPRFRLEPEEFQAIIAHDGQYCLDNKSYANKEHPLTLLLHYADSWSASQLEGKDGMRV